MRSLADSANPSAYPAFLLATAAVNPALSPAHSVSHISCLFSPFSLGNQGGIKLTLSGFGKIAPDGVDTTVLPWVVLDMLDVFKPVLRLSIPAFLAESRSGSRSILVAIFTSNVIDRGWDVSEGGLDACYGRFVTFHRKKYSNKSFWYIKIIILKIIIDNNKISHYIYTLYTAN